MRAAGRRTYLLAVLLALTLCACAAKTPLQPQEDAQPVLQQQESPGVEAPSETVQNRPAPPERPMQEAAQEQAETSEQQPEQEETEEEGEQETMLKIEIGEKVMFAQFSDNASAQALREKLAEGPLVLEMHDYGGFEKVGDLPWTLPRSDEDITTSPGDVILYLGSQLTIYYGVNTWDFTRVAHIPDVDKAAMQSFLGEGVVTATFSLSSDE